MSKFNFSIKRKLIFIIIFLIVLIDLGAQPANWDIVTQSTEWFVLATTMKVSNRINLYADAHLRYVHSFEPAQDQIRVAGEWVISKKLTIVPFGYVYVRNFIYGEQPAAYINNEHRIYQQAVLKYTSGKFGFNHRFRIEERFIQTHHSDPSGEVIDDGFDENKQMRFRYRGSITYPLNKSKIEPKALFLSVYDEFFISWGKKVTFHKPDQNRIFAGLCYQFTKDISLQSGFFYQMLIKSNGAKQENNVGIMTQLTYNLDLTKKKD
jgi:hypothetical protein